MFSLKFIKTNIFFLAILTIIVFLLYGKSIFWDFTYCDDSLLIKDNIDYISNVANIPKYFITSCYYNNDNNYYRPILSLSFSMEAIIFGLNTKVFHTTNIILFSLALCLMYLLLIKLNFDSFILKFIFIFLSVHPIFVSTVCWIPARNDTLLVIFLVLSIMFFLDYLNNNLNKKLFLFVLFFVLSLFTKETTIFFIPIYFILIYSFDYNATNKQLKYIIMIILSILIVYFLLRYQAVPNKSSIDFILKNYSECLTNCFLGTMKYIEKIFSPINIPIMQYNININFNIFIINILFFIIMLVSLYYKFLSKKMLVLGFCWFILCLFPTFLIKEYTWIPSRIILPCFGILIIFLSILKNLKLNNTNIKKIMYVLFGVIFISEFSISYVQANKFKDGMIYNICLYNESPTYHSVCYGLALQYLKNDKFDEYKQMINKAYELSGDDRYVLDKINILLYEKNIEEAEKISLNILKTEGVSVFHKKGALKNLVNIYFIKKNVQLALYYAQQYYLIDSNNVEIIQQLAQLYAITGKYNEAICFLLKIEGMNKNNYKYYLVLSELYKDLGDLDLAQKYMEKSKNIKC